jgi:hypothetical protein
MTIKSRRGLLEKPVKSLSAYLQNVERLIRVWSPRRDFYPWFRGHGDGTWPLIPKVYRRQYRDLVPYEHDFREDFQQLAWSYLSEAAWEPSSEWEWYFLMQHHGLPTRLLDWTESALVALYFALTDSLGHPERTSNPAVWALDPWALNKKVAKKGDAILNPSRDNLARYLPNRYSKRKLPLRPIAIQPPHKSKRIAAQQGFFTVHGASLKSLETYIALFRCCTKIEIARSHVRVIREQLLVAGIAETTVFPELDGLCRELLDFYNYEYEITSPHLSKRGKVI